MSGASPVVRTRKSVLTLGQPGDDLDWYARAVADLRQRPLTDPTGWRYQSAVHGYPGAQNDPFATPGEARRRRHGTRLHIGGKNKSEWPPLHNRFPA